MNPVSMYSQHMALVDTDTLGGRQEIARIFHVESTTIGSWYDRRAVNGFPEAVARFSMGPLWEIPKVIAWYRDWPGPTNGHPKVGYLNEDELETING